jgi:uncharacterized membrane protein
MDIAPTPDSQDAAVDSGPLKPAHFGPGHVVCALRMGWHVLRVLPGPSIALGTVLASVGAILAAAVILIGASPLLLVLAGGFLLIAPALLAGFFALFLCHERGERPGIRAALDGFARAGTGFWVLAGLCAFLFLIWVTDAGVLYAFSVGSGPLLEPQSGPGAWPTLTQGVRQFALWSLPLGAVIALGLYCVSVFSVPLVYERRSGVVSAIHSSVAAVFQNPLGALAWGSVIALGTLLGIVLLPLLTVTLPILTYGGFALYRAVFPVERDPVGETGTGDCRGSQ